MPAPPSYRPPARHLRRILLMDADQFFVQVARLVDPEGAGRAEVLLVGGAPERRGVVASASYGARKCGAHSAMPMARAVALCRGRAMVVPIPRRQCVERSRAIRAVLQRWAPRVGAASIDEAYLDLSGTEALYGGAPLEEVARRIQADVKHETAITVSLGGGTSKVIAKLASRPAKPGGVFVVPPGGELDFMRGLALADIPGVGPVFAERLRSFGLLAVADGLDQDVAALERMFRGRGRWLWERMRGLDDGVVETERETKSLSREETFATDLERDEDLVRELLALASQLGADARDEGLLARTITVRIRDADFRTRQAGFTLPAPVDSDAAIAEVARTLLGKLRRRRRTPARLLGIALSNFAAGRGVVQLGLFGGDATTDGAAPVESERDRRISRIRDALRKRFGSDVLSWGESLERGDSGHSG
jgi:DNA polymerase IV